MSNSPNNKKGGPVFGYLAIMFAAAFLMLLLAYFIQQRNNSVAMEGLRDSISSFKSLDALQEENKLLEQQLEALEAEQEQLREEYEKLESEYQLEHAYALSWDAFWNLESLFVQERYEECVQEIQAMYYSTFYQTPQSALERIQEIQDTLLDLGYLTVQYTISAE